MVARVQSQVQRSKQIMVIDIMVGGKHFHNFQINQGDNALLYQCFYFCMAAGGVCVVRYKFPIILYVEGGTKHQSIRDRVISKSCWGYIFGSREKIHSVAPFRQQVQRSYRWPPAAMAFLGSVFYLKDKDEKIRASRQYFRFLPEALSQTHGVPL